MNGAHASQWDRIPPPLFDRLFASNDLTRGHLMTRHEYLAAVKRDVIRLLRCETMPAEFVAVVDTFPRPLPEGRGPVENAPEKTLADFENVKKSVLCYGIPAFSGIYGVQKAGPAMASAMHNSIRTHDPRLQNLSVRQIMDKANEVESSVASFGFKIEGTVRMESLAQDFVLRADYAPVFSKWQFEGDRNGR